MPCLYALTSFLSCCAQKDYQPLDEKSCYAPSLKLKLLALFDVLVIGTCIVLGASSLILASYKISFLGSHSCAITLVCVGGGCGIVEISVALYKTKKAWEEKERNFLFLVEECFNINGPTTPLGGSEEDSRVF